MIAHITVQVFIKYKGTILLIGFKYLFEGLDSWVNLTRVDPDEEVQGEIHLCLELLRDAEKASVRCKVIEAR